MRAARAPREKGKLRDVVMSGAPPPPFIEARNIQRKLGHVPRNERDGEEEYQEERKGEREVKEREQKLWRTRPRL